MNTTVMNTTIINLHALQAVPASLLNRDDNNSAKTIPFGGVVRPRVASQAWKRAMRIHVRKQFAAQGAFADRSNRWHHAIAKRLVEEWGMAPERAGLLARATLGAARFPVDDKDVTAVAIFAHTNMAADVAKAIAEHDAEFVDEPAAEPAKPKTRKGKKPAADEPAVAPAPGIKVPAVVSTALINALSVFDAADLALMGRMLTHAKVDLRVDGGVSVDHAMGVQPAAIVDDFFTAVDDLAINGEVVSNNLGVVDLTAPVFYRTAAIDVEQVRRNLQGADDPDALTNSAIAAFIAAFVQAVPSAKQNSTNVGTLPSLVVGTVGTTRLTAHNAFTVPIVGERIVGDSIDALLATLHTQRRMTAAQRTVLLSGDPTADGALAGSADVVGALGAQIVGDLDEFVSTICQVEASSVPPVQDDEVA